MELLGNCSDTGHCFVDIDECSSSPCHNAGTCTDAVNGYICDCADGYNGDNCETGMSTNLHCLATTFSSM